MPSRRRVAWPAIFRTTRNFDAFYKNMTPTEMRQRKDDR
jgi:hypothetical protein